MKIEIFADKTCAGLEQKINTFLQDHPDITTKNSKVAQSESSFNDEWEMDISIWWDD